MLPLSPSGRGRDVNAGMSGISLFRKPSPRQDDHRDVVSVNFRTDLPQTLGPGRVQGWVDIGEESSEPVAGVGDLAGQI